MLTFWYVTIQYKNGKLRWIFFVCTLFKTNYILVTISYVSRTSGNCSLRHVTNFSFKRPFIRLWFYATFILIEFRSSVRSYASRCHRRKSCILFNYLWIQYKKNKYKRKESINPLKYKRKESINPRKLIKRV